MGLHLYMSEETDASQIFFYLYKWVNRIMVQPSQPLFTCQRVRAKMKAPRRGIQGPPAGTSDGCIAVDVTLPTFPSSSPLNGRSITVCLVVVNEAILNIVIKKKLIIYVF